jgi:hypothetical protein
MGCVFAELVLRRPWLPAETDIQQLGLIFSVLGTPREDTWKGVADLPSYLPFTPCQGQPLEEIFPQVCEVAAHSVRLQFCLQLACCVLYSGQYAYDLRFRTTEQCWTGRQ